MINYARVASQSASRRAAVISSARCNAGGFSPHILSQIVSLNDTVVGHALLALARII